MSLVEVPNSRFINYWCGCVPAQNSFCREALKVSPKNGEQSWLFDQHVRVAEVCLGVRTIENIDEIPQMPANRYEIDVEWKGLLRTVQEHEDTEGLDLMPRFQRGHVWSRDQQIAYVEAMMMGMEVARTIIFNHYEFQFGSGTPPYPKGTMVILDGLQRLTAVSKFLRNEIPVFGLLRNEFKGVLRFNTARFKFRILSLPDEAAVIRMYLALNSAGTPHTPEEIERVKALLSNNSTES